MPSTLSDNVLKKIEEEKLTPKPRWQFLLRRSTLWGVAIAALIVGGLATSVILFVVTYNNWDLYHYVHDGKLFFIARSLPYAWFLLLGVLLFVAEYNIRHTERGYRYTIHTIVFGSMALSVVLGGGFYMLGVGEALDDHMTDRVPYYTRVANPTGALLTKPERGVLGGVVVSVPMSEEQFELKDFHGKLWVVQLQEVQEINGVRVQVNRKVLVVGEKHDDDTFIATRIRPLHPSRMKHDHDREPQPRAPFPIEPVHVN